ncbi:MAG: hypothetical protein Q3M30_05110 [Candidatus Electrothrix sp. Rat3]|nr:hypothetical protein [Candidatus Electrothrix rattekaaiensis]
MKLPGPEMNLRAINGCPFGIKYIPKGRYEKISLLQRRVKGA